MEILSRIKSLVVTLPRFTMLEFGACDGYHTNLFLQMLRRSGKPFILHAFEPESANYNTCCLKFAGQGDVHLWNLAVAADVGERKFYVSGGGSNGCYYGSSSIREPKGCRQAWPEMSFVESVVRTTTLDAFSEEQAVEFIDFIWADIQGAEVDLIRGGEKTWSRVRYLYTEYCDGELYEGEIGRDAICSMLPDFELIEDYGGDVLLRNRAFGDSP